MRFNAIKMTIPDGIDNRFFREILRMTSRIKVLYAEIDRVGAGIHCRAQRCRGAGRR